MVTKKFDDTDRKIAIAVAKGLPQREICRDVGLCRQGVEYRLSRMASAIGANNSASAVVALAVNGFFTVDELREICGEVTITLR